MYDYQKVYITRKLNFLYTSFLYSNNIIPTNLMGNNPFNLSLSDPLKNRAASIRHQRSLDLLRILVDHYGDELDRPNALLAHRNFFLLTESQRLLFLNCSLKFWSDNLRMKTSKLNQKACLFPDNLIGNWKSRFEEYMYIFTNIFQNALRAIIYFDPPDRRLLFCQRSDLVLNISSRILSSVEMSLLAKDLSFCPTQNKSPSFQKFKLDFSLFCLKLRRSLFFNEHNYDDEWSVVRQALGIKSNFQPPKGFPEIDNFEKIGSEGPEREIL
jgi:hypothetical protein